MLLPNVPPVNAGTLYCNKLSIGATGTTNGFGVSAGACRDAFNLNDIILPNFFDVHGDIVGAGGVDVAPIVPNQFYQVFVIGDSTGYKPTSVILSIISANDGPIMPLGYDMYRRIGWVGTDDTAAPNTKILKWYQYGYGQDRIYYYDKSLEALSNGSSVNIYTPVNILIPPINTIAIVNVGYQPSDPANTCSFAPLGSPQAAIDSGMIIFSCGSTGLQKLQTNIPAHFNLSTLSTQILYRNREGDFVTLNTIGFYDFI